jgi:D-3-phosphoglycerate dehydrogenase / 2-oxoglutarate reductase
VPSFDEFLYRNKLPMSLSYPKSRLSVLLLENIDNDAVTVFEKEGYHVEYHKKSLPEDELIEKIRHVSLLGVRSRTYLNDNILRHAEHLLAVGAYVIGTNLIDLSSAAKKGIAIFNAPYGSTRSVVELVISEMMVLIRGIVEKSNKLHAGIWDKSANGSREIKGKTLGIIGYGTIGTQVGLLAEALGMDVCFYDLVERPILGNALRCETLEELLKKSDIITVHVDGRKENTNLISEKEFSRMKDDVIFLNASRGFVVDIDALVTYLNKGKVRSAAIDVFPKEPRSNDEPFISDLQKFPNVILTPHIGAATKEAQKNIAQFVSHKLIEYVNTGNTYLSVNLPNIQFQMHGHRLLHIHNNVPGILAKINNTFAENNINVLGQQLKTNEHIGYVITDVDQKYDKKILQILKQIPDTIKLRVLY